MSLRWLLPKSCFDDDDACWEALALGPIHAQHSHHAHLQTQPPCVGVCGSEGVRSARVKWTGQTQNKTLLAVLAPPLRLLPLLAFPSLMTRGKRKIQARKTHAVPSHCLHTHPLLMWLVRPVLERAPGLHASLFCLFFTPHYSPPPSLPSLLYHPTPSHHHSAGTGAEGETSTQPWASSGCSRCSSR